MSNICPFHTGVVVTPCQLQACDLWLAAMSAFNRCGWLAYAALAPTSGDGIGWKEMGELLDQDVDSVKLKVQLALDQIRLAKLRERVAPCQKWSLLKGSKQCVVCHKPAEIFKSGWGWCSKTCLQWSPPALLEVEEKIGVHLHEALQKRYVDARFLARVTGLDRVALQWLLWQRLGIAEGSSRWRKQKSALVPNPSIPNAPELRRRLKRAECWK